MHLEFFKSGSKLPHSKKIWRTKSLKIAIDARSAMIIDGIGRMTFELIRHLGIIDKENQYYLFFHRDYPKIEEVLSPNFKKYIIHFKTGFIPLKVFWHEVLIPYHCKKLKVDVFHQPNFISARKGSFKKIVTIHDLSTKIYPEQKPFNVRWYYNMYVSNTIKKADIIMADSENTKKDIIRYYNVDKEKIKVVYPGVMDYFREINDKNLLNKVRDKYKLPEEYIFFVGTIEPRKNLVRLLKAFSEVIKGVNKSIFLVIAGYKGWLTKPFFKMLNALGISEKVLLLGYVNEEDLPALYNSAKIFVFPSIYEGFGIPPLEAMACGTPVIASNASSIPEVVGDSAILVDPYDEKMLANEIINLLKDNNLQKELSEKGLKRAKLFSWEKMAKEVLEIYKN